MGDTWTINMLHSLDDNGDFTVPLGPARRLSEYMGSIVDAVTSRAPDNEDRVTAIECRRRPDHVRCLAHVIAGYSKDDLTTIIWQCPACGDEGYISGWQETLWDKRQFY